MSLEQDDTNNGDGSAWSRLQDNVIKELYEEKGRLLADYRRIENQLRLSEQHASTMARDFDASLAVVQSERNQLKAENEKLRKLNMEEYTEAGWNRAKEVEVENEKLRAMVAAKDGALNWLIKERFLVPETDNEMFHKCLAALSPEIANEFVRREVLEQLFKAILAFMNDATTLSIQQTLGDALSSAETELAKGKQP